MRSRTRSARSLTAGLRLEDLLERARPRSAAASRAPGRRPSSMMPRYRRQSSGASPPAIWHVPAAPAASIGRSVAATSSRSTPAVLRRLHDRLQAAHELDVAGVQVLVAAHARCRSPRTARGRAPAVRAMASSAVTTARPRVRRRPARRRARSPISAMRASTTATMRSCLVGKRRKTVALPTPARCAISATPASRPRSAKTAAAASSTSRRLRSASARRARRGAAGGGCVRHRPPPAAPSAARSPPCRACAAPRRSTTAPRTRSPMPPR